MTEHIEFTIDGESVRCERDDMLLDVARRNGFDIPSTCYHEAHAPYGACRLCVVEVAGEGWSEISPSCTYPVRDQGIEVRTSTEKVDKLRRMNMELLLARCPDSDRLKGMAERLGVDHTRFPADGEDACISCGLCVNICRDLVGAAAISFTGRGMNRHVSTPFDEPSEACIGCGACAEVCPTGHIRVDDRDDGTREIVPFETVHELVTCPSCGRGYVTRKQLEQLEDELAEKRDILRGCPECREQDRVDELRKAYCEALTLTEEE